MVTLLLRDHFFASYQTLQPSNGHRPITAKIPRCQNSQLYYSPSFDPIPSLYLYCNFLSLPFAEIWLSLKVPVFPPIVPPGWAYGSPRTSDSLPQHQSPLEMHTSRHSSFTSRFGSIHKHSSHTGLAAIFHLLSSKSLTGSYYRAQDL